MQLTSRLEGDQVSTGESENAVFIHAGRVRVCALKEWFQLVANTTYFRTRYTQVESLNIFYYFGRKGCVERKQTLALNIIHIMHYSFLQFIKSMFDCTYLNPIILAHF